MSEAVQVTVNGEPRSFEAGLSVRALIEKLDLNPETVAVERNREIVKRDRFDTQQIGEGDRIEVVEFVGGG
ncbi:MAG: sulfur carrier protein ThiS [Acidobacteria bacterium]|nr:sulfur carrier protein ThiS [Acidobacteriota bacterium]